MLWSFFVVFAITEHVACMSVIYWYVQFVSFSVVFLYLFQMFIAGYSKNPLDRRFHCNVCGRNYVQKKHVLRHIRYECINVAPHFYCANCSKHYRQSNNLLHHIRQKHGPLARDTFNSTGYTQQNFKVADDGRVVFSCVWFDIFNLNITYGCFISCVVRLDLW